MKKEIEDKILNYIKNLKRAVNIKQLAEALKLSYSTALKYVDILSAQGKIKVEDLGRVKVILPK
ncbi:MAG: HTH domain-containing protein [Nanoarchaeota archaeon]